MPPVLTDYAFCDSFWLTAVPVLRDVLRMLCTTWDDLPLLCLLGKLGDMFDLSL